MYIIDPGTVKPHRVFRYEATDIVSEGSSNNSDAHYTSIMGQAIFSNVHSLKSYLIGFEKSIISMLLT